MEHAVILVLVNIPDEDWSYKIVEQRKVIGRSITAQIRVPERFEQVSRRHAEVWREKNRTWIRDVGSRGGTFVNGICLEKGRVVNLAVGDRLTLSDVEFKVVAEVSKLAELLVEAGIDMLARSAEETGSGTDIKRVLPPGFVREMLRQLTPAELEVVLWMYRGYTSDAELGVKLHRSPNTIRTQVGKVYEKFNVHSRAEIVSWLKRAAPAPLRAERRERPTCEIAAR